MTLKLILHKIMQDFYADFETVEKNAKNLLIKELQAKGCRIGDFPLLYY
jgi:hypothetical protein